VGFKLIRLLLLLTVFLNFCFSLEFEYHSGRGLRVKPISLTVGGYVNLYYEKDFYKKHTQVIEFDDIAIFAFGKVTKRVRYFLELEGDELIGFKISGEESFRRRVFFERAYLDFLISEIFKVRIGRFITPLGVWNPVHISVLKWTSSDPFTSWYFFPRFITGVQLFGRLPSGFRYSFFVQKNKGISEAYNNYLTREAVGFELRKELKNFLDIGINFGSFKIEKPEERIDFAGINFQFFHSKGEISGEFAYGNEREYYLGRNSYRYAFYLQNVYEVFKKHFLILRYDHFKDKSDKKEVSGYTFGWNFKPFFYVSVKLEYQFRTDYDRVLASFSWMF